MADKLKQIPQKLLDIWKSWSVKQRVLIIGSIVAFIAVVSIVAVSYTHLFDLKILENVLIGSLLNSSNPITLLF